MLKRGKLAVPILTGSLILGMLPCGISAVCQPDRTQRLSDHLLLSYATIWILKKSPD